MYLIQSRCLVNISPLLNLEGKKKTNGGIKEGKRVKERLLHLPRPDSKGEQEKGHWLCPGVKAVTAPHALSPY